MGKKKTHAEYVAELAVKNPNIEVIGIYMGANVKIPHRCKIDGYIWDVAPNNTLYGKGCPKCVGNIKKTHKEYVKELAIKNPTVEVIDKYINTLTKITHRCTIHNFEWKTSPGSALKGGGCPLCRSEKISNSTLKTHEKYVSEVKQIDSNIIVIGKYINAKTPILHKCEIDGCEWNASPSNILSGYGCPKCGLRRTTESHRMTNEEYTERLAKINPNIIALEEYTNSQTLILHKCLIDGYEWKIRPKNTLNGIGCPKCSESKGERRIRIWLENNNIDYIHQHKYEDCKDIHPLPFDFYISTYNVLIEYDGEQHFRPIDLFGGQEYFEYIQKHDAIKNEYCKNNGIPLLRIPYYKYNNIEEELNNFLFI